MADALKTNIQLVIAATYTRDLDMSDPLDKLALNLSDALAHGTGADKANRMWHDSRQAAGSVDDIDLAGGVNNCWGEAITFTKLKLIYIRNKTLTSGYLITLGVAVSHPLAAPLSATSTFVVGPGGTMFVWNPVDGYAVADETADQLRIAPGANTIDYDIIVIGEGTVA